MANRPGFFKFYIPSLGQENRKIPPRFIQSIQGTWPMNLALRDHYDNLWHVKVEKVGDDWYFKDGWKKFTDENMIKGGDLLVYEYFSRGLLDFKVHDGSACLTKGVGCRKTKSTEEQNTTIILDDDDDDDDDVGQTQENGYHKGEKVIDDDTDDIGYDPRTEEDYQQDDQVELLMDDTDDDRNALTLEEDNQKFQFSEAVEVTDDDNHEEDCFPTTEEESRQDAYHTGKELLNVCQYVQTTRELDRGRTQRGGPRYNNPQVEQLGDASTSKRKTTRDHDWYGVDIFRTGLIPQPKNPYFVTKRRQRASELYIPMDVIKGYNLKLPKDILLLDPKGRQFRARRKVWSDERTFYVGGWKTLCGMNLVGGEDYCICEFMRNDGVLCINVSFFPPKRELTVGMLEWGRRWCV